MLTQHRLLFNKWNYNIRMSARCTERERELLSMFSSIGKYVPRNMIKSVCPQFAWFESERSATVDATHEEIYQIYYIHTSPHSFCFCIEGDPKDLKGNYKRNDYEIHAVHNKNPIYQFALWTNVVIIWTFLWMKNMKMRIVCECRARACMLHDLFGYGFTVH